MLGRKKIGISTMFKYLWQSVFNEIVSRGFSRCTDTSLPKSGEFYVQRSLIIVTVLCPTEEDSGM